MRTLTGLLAVALASSVSATEPPPPAAATTSTSQPASEPDSSKAPTTGQAPKLVLTAGDSAAATELKRLKAAGYKPEAHGSEIWFCRKEAVLGSRFEKKICNTADQLIHQEADARMATDKITRRISGDPLPLPGQR